MGSIISSIDEEHKEQPKHSTPPSKAVISADDEEKDVALAKFQKAENVHYSLSNVSLSLRNDKDVVLAACQQNGMELQYASSNLRKDKEVVLTAFRSTNRQPFGKG